MKKQKRIISFLTAAAMAVTVNFSAAAEAIAEPELTDIHGYMCYERDGEYWTNLDGVEYLVINLDNLAVVSDEADAFENNSSAYSSNAIDCPIGTPSQYGWWTYTGWVDLRNGGSYKDRCYLTYGNYHCPIYVFSPKATNGHLYESRFSLSTEVVLPNTYNLTMSFHTQGIGWHPLKDFTITFSAFKQLHAILTGTLGPEMDGVAIRFNDSSTGQKELYYTINIPA